MLKYPDFDLEWENMHMLGKPSRGNSEQNMHSTPSQDNNDDKKWWGTQLDPLQHKSVAGLEISLTQICWMMLPMKKVCKMERMIFKPGQSLKLVCLWFLKKFFMTMKYDKGLEL